MQLPRILPPFLRPSPVCWISSNPICHSLGLFPVLLELFLNVLTYAYILKCLPRLFSSRFEVSYIKVFGYFFIWVGYNMRDFVILCGASSFPDGVCWRGCLLTDTMCRCLCQDPVESSWLGWFPSPVLYSVGLSVCFCASATLGSSLWLVVYFEIRNYDDPSIALGLGWLALVKVFCGSIQILGAFSSSEKSIIGIWSGLCSFLMKC